MARKCGSGSRLDRGVHRKSCGKIETDVDFMLGIMVTKEQLDALKERFVSSETDEERIAVRTEMKRICDEDVKSVTDAMKSQLEETHREADALLVREQLSHVLPSISLAYIARTYFHKSRAWLYQRVNGLIVNGKPASFTPDEIKTLNRALNDLGRQLSSIHIS